MYKQFQLQNGITVGLFHMDSVRSVAMKAMLVAGPVTENEKNTGVSHFIEHCVLDGTTSYPTKLAFANELEELGISYGGYTSVREMAFEFDVPYTNLFPAIDILKEILFEPLFTDEAIEKERKVIMEELIDSDNSNDRQFYYACANMRYTKPHHQLKMNVVGTRHSLEAMTKDSLLDHYQKIMVPNNIFVCLVGNLDLEKTKAYLEKTLGMISAKTTFSRPQFSKKDLSSYQTAGVHNDKFTNAYASIMFGGYSREVPVKQRMTLQTMSTMLGNLRTSRLFQDVREKEGLVYNISSGWDASFGVGSFNISFESDVANLERILTIVFEDLAKIKKDGFSKKELEHIRSYFKNRILLSFSTPWNINGWILDDLFDLEEVKMPEDIIAIGDTITMEDISKVISDIFQKQSMNILVMGNLDEKIVSPLLTHYTV